MRSRLSLSLLASFLCVSVCGFGTATPVLADTPATAVESITLPADPTTPGADNDTVTPVPVSSPVSPTTTDAVPAPITEGATPAADVAPAVDYSQALANIQYLLLGVLAACSIMAGSVALHFFWRAMLNA